MDTNENSVSLVRIINAPAEAVFAAWTDATLMRHWLAPEPSERTAIEVDVEPRVRGRYRIVVIGPGDLLVTAGEYRELVPGKRLVMTWSCTDPLVSFQDATTLITVEMRALGAGRTEMTLVHSGVAPGDERGLREGWTASLDRLEVVLAGQSRSAPQYDRAAS
ncbi:MAG TPA: SRPBCC domain-containing protein [Hyphomicrobiaceae bacterium]|jgi:uncharacterized protein YndB with AHSA1/START domain|nr:SRPBCC domain-containing protein [Hyphomicrobiaceae bacterium]